MAATGTPSCAALLHGHMLGVLLGQSRATVTNLICSRGGQHHDWSADYRLYSRGRVDEAVLFGRARDALLDALPAGEPLVAAIDDTIVRKTGRKIHGSGWKRDPLGPAFQTNLVHARRYLQISAAWPLEDGGARMVPVGFHHAPTPRKPGKDATPARLKDHREALKQHNLNRVALEHVGGLRRDIPDGRHLVLCGDGSFTNKAVLRGLPDGCTYIGRTRKDTALHHPPEPPVPGATGRPPRYGKKAPTAEELRQDDSVPWQIITAHAAGKRHDFRVKTCGPVLWPKAGPGVMLRLVVIAPLAYRLKKGSRLLYREPAYLLCTDPDLPLEKLLQYYLWRWGIEVNFREEKTLLGTGEAQVRTAASNRHLPAVTVAAYSLLWIAALQCHAAGDGDRPRSLAPPKWRKDRPDGMLPATGELQRLLRYEIWAGALRPGTFHRFVTRRPPDASAPEPRPDLAATLFAAA
ncbi:transposase [Luteolibacter sp. Populi]|uniref:IS701 family transposase n=1 Tax=Luteolibacter sp. Populi TaxID=3230487 RepID=UPI0034659509